MNTDAAAPSPRVTVSLKVTGPVIARPLLVATVVSNVAPPELRVSAGEALEVLPSADTVPAKVTAPEPALTLS